MKRTSVAVLALVVFAAPVFGQSIPDKPIVIPIEDYGTVSIKDFGFLPNHDWDLKADFSFEYDSTMKPPSPAKITLTFDVGGLCDGNPRQWTGTAALLVTGTSQIVDFGYGSIKTGSTTGCTAELVRVHLVQAVCQGFAKGAFVMSELFRVQGEPFEPFDFTDQLLRVKAEQTAQQGANDKAIEDGRRAERELNRERSDACRRLYRVTADKRVSDLTVKESQLINACQALGLCQ